MALPASGNPISFSDINTEQSLPASSPLDLGSAGTAFSLNINPVNWSDATAGLGMDEFHGKSIGPAGPVISPTAVSSPYAGGAHVISVGGAKTWYVENFPAAPFSSRNPFGPYSPSSTFTITINPAGPAPGGPYPAQSGQLELGASGETPIVISIDRTALSPGGPTPTPTAPSPLPDSISVTPTGPVSFFGGGQARTFTITTSPASVTWSVSATPAHFNQFPAPQNPFGTSGTGPATVTVNIGQNLTSPHVAIPGTLTVSSPAGPIDVPLVQERYDANSNAELQNPLGTTLLSGLSGTYPIAFDPAGQIYPFQAGADFSVPYTVSVPGPQSSYASIPNSGPGSTDGVFLVEMSSWSDPSPRPAQFTLNFATPLGPYATYYIAGEQAGTSPQPTPQVPQAGPTSPVLGPIVRPEEQ